MVQIVKDLRTDKGDDGESAAASIARQKKEAADRKEETRMADRTEQMQKKLMDDCGMSEIQARITSKREADKHKQFTSTKRAAEAVEERVHARELRWHLRFNTVPRNAKLKEIGELDSLMALAADRMARKDLPSAIDQLNVVTKMANEMQQDEIEAKACQNLGYCLLQTEVDPTRAVSFFDRAIELYQKLDDQLGLFHTMQSKGSVLLTLAARNKTSKEAFMKTMQTASEVLETSYLGYQHLAEEVEARLHHKQDIGAPDEDLRAIADDLAVVRDGEQHTFDSLRMSVKALGLWGEGEQSTQKLEEDKPKGRPRGQTDEEAAIVEKGRQNAISEEKLVNKTLQKAQLEYILAVRALEKAMYPPIGGGKMTEKQVRAEMVLIDQGKRTMPKSVDPSEDVFHSLMLAKGSFAVAEEVIMRSHALEDLTAEESWTYKLRKRMGQLTDEELLLERWQSHLRVARMGQANSMQHAGQAQLQRKEYSECCYTYREAADIYAKNVSIFKPHLQLYVGQAHCWNSSGVACLEMSEESRSYAASLRKQWEEELEKARAKVKEGKKAARKNSTADSGKKKKKKQQHAEEEAAALKMMNPALETEMKAEERKAADNREKATKMLKKAVEGYQVLQMSADAAKTQKCLSFFDAHDLAADLFRCDIARRAKLKKENHMKKKERNKGKDAKRKAEGIEFKKVQRERKGMKEAEVEQIEWEAEERERKDMMEEDEKEPGLLVPKPVHMLTALERAVLESRDGERDADGEVVGGLDSELAEGGAQ
jgi:hypothetical protein